MGGCAGKLNVSDISRLASLPRQISFSRTKSQPQHSDPQVNGKEEGEKVENKVGGSEEKSGGEEKKEASLVDLSVEGETSSSDQPKTAAVPADSAMESKVETPTAKPEDNVNSSTENKVETPFAEVVDNATPDNKVETLVNDSSEDKAETIASNSSENKVATPVTNSGNKAEAVITKKPEVEQPETAPAKEPEEAAPVKEPEAKPEALPATETEAKQPETVAVKEPEGKQPETAPTKVEDKSDAAPVAL